ncbi:MAG TPA: LuxR C-terminal-related transcriptional regulator [Gaiellaceae bacterium]|nr:LuxR C-terminal-related transcriptional regulator [Gaiellaceae bacterium]
MQLDELLASIAPEVPREPQKVASIASVNASPTPLGRAILRTFESLTQDVLLVVDEWEAAGTDEAEELLSMLVGGLDIRFLITTRTRPEWFTPRLEVYGEGLEIGVDELTMTDEEATEVLAALGAVAGRARLMRAAGGWPAVLGLAAMSGDVDFTSSRLLTHTLYDFLASELLDAAEPETQTALMLLAVASVPDVEVARCVLGAEADDVLEEAVARGLLAVTERKLLSLHPLLRELLLRRFDEADGELRAALLAHWRRLCEASRWDEALCVAEAALDAPFVTEAIAAALDDLLAAGRTSSLQRWVAAARTAGAEGGLIDYAESEALLRKGEFDHALAVASMATRSLEGDLAARAHLVSARAAHLNDRAQLATSHAESAAALALGDGAREDALWLRFIVGRELVTTDLEQRLKDFQAAARPGVKRSLLSACADLYLAEMHGGLGSALDVARGALAMAKDSEDSIAHTALLSGYSFLLTLAGRYQDALLNAERLAAVAESGGIDFPLRYAEMNKAGAYIGLRRFALADRALAMLERQTQDDHAAYFHGNLRIQRARLYTSLGNVQRALDALSLGPDAHSSHTARAAFAGWQALLSAIVSEPEDLAPSSDLPGEVDKSIEGAALFLLARAVTSIRHGDVKLADGCLDAAIGTEAIDPVLIAVRAEPALARRAAERDETRTWLKNQLAGSRDASLARSLGLEIPRPARQKQQLTPREAEVHELLAQGLTNEEIAKLLYISLSTTKVHVKHIYDKLGVRSRLEAARALRDDV